MAVVIIITTTTITKQPGDRREVKWLMFSFDLHIDKEQNKQETAELS